MYVSGSPRDGRAPSLCISRAERAAFDEPSAAALDPGLRVYLTDLVRPSGLALREDVLASGSGQSYGEMGAALIGATVPGGQPVDLLMLAYAVPDVCPERATASYLSHVCPGQPMAFGICDQGSAAAFTGLRLAGEYGGSRVLLLVAEQAAMPYDPGDAPVPGRHAAVALLCGPAGAGPARVRRVREHADVAPAQLASLVRADADVLILGATLTGHVIPGEAVEVRVAPAGQPSTGVWWELAGGLAEWMAAGRRVVVADYDPVLRYLCMAEIGSAETGGQPRHD